MHFRDHLKHLRYLSLIGRHLVVQRPQTRFQPPLGEAAIDHRLGRRVHLGKGAQMVRGAGTGAQVLAREERYTLIRMPSGELRRVLSTCYSTIGQLGNVDHKNLSWGKAGRKRLRGWRPTVRGSAMSPRDHPHGGGPEY